MRKIFLMLLIVHLTFNIENCMCQWVQTGGPNNTIPLCFFVSGNNLFCGTWGLGVFLSTNNGMNWTAVNNGLTTSGIQALTGSGTNLFAGTSSGGGVFLSSNNGTNWTAVNNGLTSQYILSLVTLGTNIYAGTSVYGTQTGGVFKSTNNGSTWTSSGLSALPVTSLVVSGTNLFAGTTTSPVYPEGGGVFLSTNGGLNWNAVNNGLSNLLVTTLIVSGTDIIAGLWSPGGGGVYKSTNNGSSWSLTGLTNVNVNSFAVWGSNLFAATSDSGIYLSTNNGLTWLRKNQGLPSPPPTLRPLIIFNNYIFVGTNTQTGTVWRRTFNEIIGIKNISSAISNQFSLQQNYPNPFNPGTSIKYQVENTKHIKLTVFNILGKEIATLVNEKQSPGTYEVTFDGSELSSGIYFYKLEAGDFSEVKKMILIK